MDLQRAERRFTAKLKRAAGVQVNSGRQPCVKINIGRPFALDRDIHAVKPFLGIGRCVEDKSSHRDIRRVADEMQVVEGGRALAGAGKRDADRAVAGWSVQHHAAGHPVQFLPPAQIASDPGTAGVPIGGVGFVESLEVAAERQSPKYHGKPHGDCRCHPHGEFRGIHIITSPITTPEPGIERNYVDHREAQ
jgi:hypothetical protein